jgi:anti-sigma factor RsiW
MDCDTKQVHAYHDGELDAARRVALEAHLRECMACAELLADLRRMSLAMAHAPLPVMPDVAMKRFQGVWQKANDRAVLRVASWFTAAAASLLFGALILWPKAQPSVAAKPAVWDTVAVMPPASGESSELVQVAQWMAEDLSMGERR